MPKIVIPRLKRLRVQNYELYPVHPELGVFEHEFVPGVNVIVGINGLGKTTLLNLMFRLLVGPFDPSKADRIRPGRKQASIKYADIDFFRERVTDHAEDAVATAVFAFGDVDVEVTRSLKNLRLLSYRCGETHQTVSVPSREADDEFMTMICGLAGFDTRPDPEEEREDGGSELPAYRYDFDFLVRNLIFFLEDKVPLIWNPEGQFVILRILLVEETLSKRISRARNALLKADSIYRNKLWAKNSLEDELKDLIKDAEERGVELSRQNIDAGLLSGLDQRVEDLEKEVSRLNMEIEHVDGGLLRTRAELYDCETVVRGEEAAYFNTAFAKARPPGDLIIQAMAGHRGCLVCGSRDEAAQQRARQRMERHCCPVCESDVAEPEGTGSLAAVRGSRLAEAEQSLAQSQRRHEALVKAGTAARIKLDEKLTELGNTRIERRRLRLLAASADEADRERDEIDRRRADIAARETEVINLEVNLRVAERAHEELIQAAQGEVARFRDDIIKAFDQYAQDFMVDECRLRFKSDRRDKVAQSDRKIDWPAFYVELSSGEETSLTERGGSETVSESQKEFIDLAFRMALMRAACRDRPSMLIVETPEASLDAFFMKRAGDLLRVYGSAEEGNILIVSSNLTSASMIPALLGVDHPGSEGLEGRERRVINLLRRARPTRALTAHRKEYDEAYWNALRYPAEQTVEAARLQASGEAMA